VAVKNDKDGNILCINGTCPGGLGVFAWDVRGHLAQSTKYVDSPGIFGTQNYAYDAFGRRIGVATQTGSSVVGVSYLYDGLNPVATLNTLGDPQIMLFGPDPDDLFNVNPITGAFSPLRDALGSVVALTDSSGALQANYQYDPYGNTTPSGTASGDSQFQYIGRENDTDQQYNPNGTYFLRNRYYSPGLGRFLSRDPGGIAGGVNLYMYAGDDPIDSSDPLGLYGNGDFGYAPGGDGFYYGFAGSGGNPGGYQGGGISWPGNAPKVSQGGLGGDIIPIYHGQNGAGLSGPRVITQQILILPLTLREEIIGQIKRLVGKSVEEEVDSLAARLNDIDLWNVMIDLLTEQAVAQQTVRILFGGTVGGIGGIVLAPSITGCQPGYETCAPGYRP
jgi:RHS repeat-associated protein